MQNLSREKENLKLPRFSKLFFIYISIMEKFPIGVISVRRVYIYIYFSLEFIYPINLSSFSFFFLLSDKQMDRSQSLTDSDRSTRPVFRKARRILRAEFRELRYEIVLLDGDESPRQWNSGRQLLIDSIRIYKVESLFNRGPLCNVSLSFSRSLSLYRH